MLIFVFYWQSNDFNIILYAFSRFLRGLQFFNGLGVLVNISRVTDKFGPKNISYLQSYYRYQYKEHI